MRALEMQFAAMRLARESVNRYLARRPRHPSSPDPKDHFNADPNIGMADWNASLLLRRTLVEASATTDGSTLIEWSHRWIVSGHWRNQWYPSSGTHELTYILPYVKGPDDKPLRISTAEVFVVNR